jgi:two-component system, OmpR family, alkaline phosphatase synthesis response regulator PhoP
LRKTGSDSNAPTVVIADDEPSVRLLVQATVAEDNLKVIEAEDGDEAWALIQEWRPKVVLLDVRMPGRTGLDILIAIKADSSLNDTRVILLTASAMESDIAAGLAAGADAYLTKPFSPRDLLARLDEALWL